jgi:hypothetical protein
VVSGRSGSALLIQVRQAIHKEVFHVPIRAPPRSTKLTEPLSVDPVLVVPLDQLWTRLLPDRRQEVLQRFTQMIVHRLTPPATHGEADDE